MHGECDNNHCAATWIRQHNLHVDRIVALNAKGKDGLRSREQLGKHNLAKAESQLAQSVLTGGVGALQMSGTEWETRKYSVEK